MAPASRVRIGVLAFAFLLAAITYLDRICISAAAPFIMEDLHLTVLQMGAVFSAFTLAYSLFEIPSGWLGDVRGPRRVLTRIVLWWSAFTMLTAAARGFPSLVAIRFLFGAGEAGAFPNIARSFSRWFPVRERGRANGVMFLGSRVGGMLSAPIALVIISTLGLARELRRLRIRRSGLGGAWYAGTAIDRRIIPRSARKSWRGFGRIRDRSHESSAAATPWRAAAPQPEPLRDLRDVLRVRVRSVLLLHVAADLPDHGARLLAVQRRALRGAAVSARRHRGPGRRLADRSLCATARPAGRALLSGLRGVPHDAPLFVFASTCRVPAALKAVLLALALASADLALGACWAVCRSTSRPITPASSPAA